MWRVRKIVALCAPRASSSPSAILVRVGDALVRRVYSALCWCAGVGAPVSAAGGRRGGGVDVGRRCIRPDAPPRPPTLAGARWRATCSVGAWLVDTSAFDWRVGERRAGRQAPWRRALFASVDRRATGARARRRRRRQRRPARVGERRACSARCSSNALARLRWRVGGRDAAGWSETLHLDRPAVVLTRTPSSTRRQNNVYGRA